MKRVVFSYLGAFFLFIAQISAVYAGNEFFNSRQPGSSLKQNFEFKQFDDKFPYMKQYPVKWKTEFTNHRITNKVILSIDPYSKIAKPNFTLSVTLEVKYETWDNLSGTFVENTVSPNPVLTVSYNPANPTYKDKAVYQFDGGNSLKVKVLSVAYSPVAALNMVPDFISLESQIDVERYYTFDRNQRVKNLGHNDSLSHSGELEVYWDFLAGAEEYELEWTHVNSFRADKTEETNPQQIPVPADIFKYNSTRITTSNNFYQIPLIYEQGYILYRVRGIARRGTDFTIRNEGKWSSPDNFTNVQAFQPHFYKYTGGHEKDLNWQFSANYAEEGKSKVAVNYFDGSLRNRQAVSRLNTENRLIVGETVYDGQGRGAIQVLPIPVDKLKLEYTPSFNLDNGSGLPYDRRHFDLDKATCLTGPNEMSVLNGASRYYSPSNPNKSGMLAYIPDAEKFPFTQVEYTPDNTGRIRRQSGVGKQYRLDSGHETRYFYGTPEQVELDRLFGADVGNSLHYKKNMVRDANGQFSISYLDMQGKVIATSLAGESPRDIVNPLPGRSLKSMHSDLLNKVRPTDRNGSMNQLNLFDRTLKLTRQILVSTELSRSFHYKVEAQKHIEACVTNSCYNCVLDLRLSLTNECGEEFLPPIGQATNNITVGAVLPGPYDDCSKPIYSYQTPGGFMTKSALKAGNYTLNKILTINEQALNNYTEDFLKTSICLTKLDSFINEELAQMDTTSCEITCEECLKRLGEYPNWTLNPYNKDYNSKCDPCYTQDEYNKLVAKCKESCDKKSIDCESKYEVMKMDMSLMGQYGEVFVRVSGADTVLPARYSNVAEPERFILSVFNDNNHLPLKTRYYGNNRKRYRPTWRYPFNPDKPAGSGLDTVYLNERGQKDYIKLSKVGSTYFPELVDTSQVIHPNGLSLSPPHKLKYVRDFIANWKSSWGVSLIVYHPEYCYYEFCKLNNNSNDYDYLWNLAVKHEEAVANGFVSMGYVNPLGNSPADAQDPYFNSSSPLFDQKEYTAMKQSMMNFVQSVKSTDRLNIWRMANITVQCPMSTCAGVDTMCYADTLIDNDAEWATFKSFYYSLKQGYVMRKMTKYAIENGCYNGCIGNSRFSGADFLYEKNGTTLNFAIKPYTNPAIMPPADSLARRAAPTTSNGFEPSNFEQPCNYPTVFRHEYDSKKKRFPKIDEMFNSPMLRRDTCYDIGPTGAFIRVPCPKQDSAIMDATIRMAELELYKKCGQCPLARQLQAFLDTVIRRKPLTMPITPNDGLACEYPQFTPDLAKTISPSGGQVFWTTNQSSTDTHLKAVMEGNNGPCGIELKFFPTSSHWKISDIKKFCCLQYEATPSLFSKQGDNNFNITATIDSAGTDIRVILEGVTTCIPVTNCTFPPICKSTQVSTDLSRLFNELANFDEFNSSNLPITLTNNTRYQMFLTDTLLKKLQEKSILPPFIWKGNMATTSLMNGAIIGSNGQVNFSFSIPAVVALQYSINDIISFSDMDIRNGNVNQFKSSVFLKNGTLQRFSSVTGTSDIDVGRCAGPLMIGGKLTY